MNWIAHTARPPVGMILGVFAPCALLGLGIQITDQDPFATARGSAFVATADNPSAVFYNPAGIVQLSGHQVRMGVYGITYEASRETFDGSSVESEREFGSVPQMYYVFTPTNAPVGFGLGAYSQFGLGMEWPEDSGFRTLGIEGRIAHLVLQPVVAWRVHRTVSIAAGPAFTYGEVELEQGLSPTPGADKFEFEGDDVSVGFSVGVRWAPWDALAFGAVYRGATKVDFDGDTRTASSGLSVRQDASAELEFPQQVALGVSWRPTPGWNVEFNAEWTDWNSFDEVQIRQSTPVPPLVLGWQSSWRYAWGATRYLPEGWRLSAGYMYAEISSPDRYYNPLVPDTERHVFSAGAGRSFGRWDFDIAYQFIHGPANSVSGSTPSTAGETADGRYEFAGHAVTVTTGFRF